ncbi:uncharacterized protein [Chelonus insularis]|uniref:uncharacterized protein n=1 Tax=Chelonus insularis TaxID=460826 RepID=UPI001589A718|nr:uncharacterized protein LOC118066183 [Chelonus insularis]XP_034937920.1 uncharacterized protein LOC118066183 [Chelonus insularis]
MRMDVTDCTYKCCNSSPYTFKYMDTYPSDNLQIFSWLVVIKNIDEPVFKLGYGALIHPRIVITSALTIQGFSSQDLVIQTNCSIANSWVLSNCIERRVIEIGNEHSIHNYGKNDYVFLILENPFLVDVIKIASDVNNINQNNCSLLRWMREVSRDFPVRELVTVKYDTSFNNGHLNVNSLNPKQLITDRDFIISRKFHSQIITDKIKDQNFLDFMGSPLICQDQTNPEKYLLAGIGTFNLRIIILSYIIEIILSIGEKNVTQEGSLINIINYSKGIEEYISHKNLSLATNSSKPTIYTF